MEGDDVAFAHVAEFGDACEVGPKFAAVTDWNAHRTPIGRLDDWLRRTLLEARDQSVVICAQRVEVHGDRPIGRHDISNTGDCSRSDGVGQCDGTGVDGRIDPRLELDDERGVACRHEANITLRQKRYHRGHGGNGRRSRKTYYALPCPPVLIPCPPW